MKKVIEIKKVEGDRIIIRLEATKRRRILMKKQRTKFLLNRCDLLVCPFCKDCWYMKSPLKKYRCFGDFCINLFSEYPDLEKRLEKFGIKNISQIVPTKRKA